MPTKGFQTQVLAYCSQPLKILLHMTPTVTIYTDFVLA